MLDIINRGDVCPLTGVILILLVLGRILASNRQKIWGAGIGIVGFLGYGAYALLDIPPKDAESLFLISVRSLIVFGLVVGLSWLVLPLLAGLWEFCRQRINLLREQDSLAGSNRELQETQEGEEEERKRTETERERLRNEGAVKIQAQDQKRRDDARASVEIFHQLHLHILAPRFDKATFDDWVKRYMNDQASAEHVEERAKQLRRLMEQHLLQIESAEATLAPKGERAEARATGRRYYDQHQALLTAYPLQLLEAYLRKEMGDHCAPEKCWDACHKLIAELQVHVQKERERQQRDEEKQRTREVRIKALDKEIADLKKQVKLQRKSPLDPDIAANEIHGLQNKIRELEAEKEGMAHHDLASKAASAG